MGRKNTSRAPGLLWIERFRTIARCRKAVEEGGEINAVCERCKGLFRVDLQCLEWRFGRHGTLVNKRGVCPNLQCGGRCVFQARASENGFMMPLIDRYADDY